MNSNVSRLASLCLSHDERFETVRYEITSISFLTGRELNSRIFFPFSLLQVRTSGNCGFVSIGSSRGCDESESTARILRNIDLLDFSHLVSWTHGVNVLTRIHGIGRLTEICFRSVTNEHPRRCLSWNPELPSGFSFCWIREGTVMDSTPSIPYPAKTKIDNHSPCYEPRKSTLPSGTTDGINIQHSQS